VIDIIHFTDYDVVIVSGLDVHQDIYATVGPALMICQLLAALEIIHPLLGWVKSGALMPTMQVRLDISAVAFYTQTHTLHCVSKNVQLCHSL